MNEDLKEILTKSINTETMMAIWFPRDWQKVIVKRAKKENMPIYKYVMMLSNNYEIIKNENEKTNEKK